jgi:hypothetical protein
MKTGANDMKTQTQEGLVGDRTVLISVTIADMLTLVLISGGFTVWSTLAGITSLLLLLAYSKHGEIMQPRIERLVSSAAFGLSSLLLLGWLLQLLYQVLGLARYLSFTGGPITLSVTWPLFAFAMWFVATSIWMKISPRQQWPRLFQE